MCLLEDAVAGVPGGPRRRSPVRADSRRSRARSRVRAGHRRSRSYARSRVCAGRRRTRSRARSSMRAGRRRRRVPAGHRRRCVRACLPAAAPRMRNVPHPTDANFYSSIPALLISFK